MGWAVNTVWFMYTLCFVLCVFEHRQVFAVEEEDPSQFEVPDGLHLASDTGIGTAGESETEVTTAVQFKTAEIADAMLGTEAAPVRAELRSLIPADATPARTGSQVSCDYGKCGSQENELLSAQPPAEESPGENSVEDVPPVTLEMVHMEAATSEEQNSTETAKTPKVNCEKRNMTEVDNLTVHILNASQDLMEFLNVNSSECSVVLFYTAWCQFSASLAPHFNALPRVFPAIHFLALDASQHSSLSTRFGTVAVPNILLFQGVKPMARFNQTDRTLGTLKAFIVNQTGIEADPVQEVTEEDHAGPLQSIPVQSIDWLLVFSIFFISSFTTYAILRTDSIRWLIPGQEHEHQD
uniref:Thioredoxin domain containing 15 n=1 Tax=Lepisosteus oculatus TaxID=7918 RepID=W5MVM8_LEPOC|nr:PREDICTED: thioredoxin domain-containing protein 15 isoform X1 [Lepisosteus oculatus]